MSWQQPGKVTFLATCPSCGQDCQWAHYPAYPSRWILGPCPCSPRPASWGAPVIAYRG